MDAKKKKKKMNEWKFELTKKQFCELERETHKLSEEQKLKWINSCCWSFCSLQRETSERFG